ncbi:MAG: polysaccharide pyruvyl transferase family protein [Desulfobacterales bacterium]|nr:polysaccharide pyruvyl transferase family protein [Desulfobacterales bacterium]
MDDLNIGLLTADLNSGNMGCNALGYSAILILEETAKLLKRSFKYTFFNEIEIKSLAQYDNIDGTKIQFVPPALTLRSKVKKILKRRGASIKYFNRSYESCDLFFEISGGDSFSDIYGIQRPRLLNLYHAKAARDGKPLVFLPQTIGPFKSNKAKKIASKSLSYASHVFVRDPISFKKALKFIVQNKVTQTIDMAFFMDYDSQKKDIGMPRIGINPSGLLWNGGYTGDNQFGLKTDYKELVARIIEELSNRKYEIVLVPHVLHGPGYHIEDDYKVCKWLQHKYSFCKIAPFFYTPVEAKSFISGLDLLIGSRMHCCIAAYSSGVPIYPLAYSRKFKGLFKEELNYPHGAELVSDDRESVIGGLQNVLDHLSDIQADMPKRQEKLTSYRQKLVDDLKRVVSSIVK